MLVRVTMAAACLAFVLPVAAGPTCSTAGTGAGCVSALNSGGEAGKRIRVAPIAPRFRVGDTLPRGRYSVLLNSEYYGLPAVDGHWRYYRVEGQVLRVRPDTLEILGDATSEAMRRSDRGTTAPSRTFPLQRRLRPCVSHSLSRSP